MESWYSKSLPCPTVLERRSWSEEKTIFLGRVFWSSSIEDRRESSTQWTVYRVAIIGISELPMEVYLAGISKSFSSLKTIIRQGSLLQPHQKSKNIADLDFTNSASFCFSVFLRTKRIMPTTTIMGRKNNNPTRETTTETRVVSLELDSSIIVTVWDGAINALGVLAGVQLMFTLSVNRIKDSSILYYYITGSSLMMLAEYNSCRVQYLCTELLPQSSWSWMYTYANGSTAVTLEPFSVSSTHLNISFSQHSLLLSSVMLTLKHCSESRVVNDNTLPKIASKSSESVSIVTRYHDKESLYTENQQTTCIHKTLFS